MIETIRQMQKTDLRKLGEIYAEVYRDFDVGEKWTKEAAEKLMGYWFQKQPDLAFVADMSGEIAGAAMAGIKPWWDGNHLSDGEIFIHPKFQKQGIATKLLVALLERAIEKYDAVSFDSFTFKKKDFPLSWYKKIGFVENADWTLIAGDVRQVLAKLRKSN